MIKKIIYFLLFLLASCSAKHNAVDSKQVTAQNILGNPNYQAICYGGYRTNTREVQPNINDVKEDLKILSAIDIKIIRTYNVHFKEITTILTAIQELKKEDSKFEMYVMLGAWIDCKNAWTSLEPIHNQESERNTTEIKEAVELANTFPDIIKIISVGNEAMVKWATAYYVTPNIILKWVNYLQELKKQKKLPQTLWVTSSDNFASWGGGDSSYHTQDLNSLINAVDYVSIHTYPMHDTHYNPTFWGIYPEEQTLDKKQKINALMLRSRNYAIAQYQSVVNYIKSIGANKPVHIGETGWATISNDNYGKNGSCATDEFKAALYYNLMREWTNTSGITCFYFEAFDESWKDSTNPQGSENNFGLFTLNGQAKYVLWDLVDKKKLNSLTRNQNKISKTYAGNENLLWQDVIVPNRFIEKKVKQ